MKEVTVIGAGLIGASIAWRLAQLGVRVALFDAGAFGGETSSAGAGMLSPNGEFDASSPWLDLCLESMRLYPGFVGELSAETGLDIDFQICGCTKFSDAPAAEGGASESARSFPGDGFVDPTHLLRALRAACLARGVQIVERAPVRRIDSAELGALVIAAGAWSNRIHVTCDSRPVDLPAVKPIKGHLIGFDLEPGALGSMLRRGHTYLLQRSNGFLIAGSTEEDAGFDRTVDAAVCRDIQARAAQLWPPLLSETPSRCWIGFRPFAASPHIRRAQNSAGDGTNVWLAYGHFRNGILLTPLTAARIAAEITCG